MVCPPPHLETNPGCATATITLKDKSRVTGHSKSGASAPAAGGAPGADVRSSAEQYMAMFAKQPTTGAQAAAAATATTSASDMRPAAAGGAFGAARFYEEPELELETGDSATRDTKPKGKSALDDDRSDKDEKSDPFW